MKNYKWSAGKNSFFPSEMIEQYVNAGWDLGDAIDIEDEIAQEFMSQPPEGKARGVGENGLPVWIDVITPNSEFLKRDLSYLSAEYQSEIESLNRAWLAAAVSDGANETSKKAAVLAQINTRKARYTTDRADVIARYPL